ncbi:MAG: hypothetical protein ABSG78_02600 [Verrucomicrobiota bacterium]|jgi:hypothetical protein
MKFDPMIDAAVCEELSGFYKAIYDRYIQEMACHQSAGNLEQAARWGRVAASHASGIGYFGILADPALEEMLLSIGRSLPAAPRDRPSSPKTTFLHVLTEAQPVGGHPRFCCRWIESDSTAHRHHVLLTSQTQTIPDDLKHTVEHCGGRLTLLNPQLPLLERARQLREIACLQADAVILHVHMDDPLPILAFAVDNTPPVLLVNHADHVYWLGVSMADLVANIRPSGQELTRHCRGIEGSVCLPIPLKDTESRLGDRRRSIEQKELERDRLGIPQEAVVFLTIASAYKYTPLNNYGFISVAQRLLERCPEAWLIAVGPDCEGPWAAASAKSGGRLMALGVKEVVSPFHEAADVYLEGFPFGSLTALLEAGLSGLPCVGAPGTTPLPMRSDDLALDHLLTPASAEDYILEALRLAGDPQARSVEGERTQTAIREHHCGAGWLKHLASVYERIPKKHKIGHGTSHPVSKVIRDYWVSFQRTLAGAGIAELLMSVYGKAEWRSLRLVESTGQRLDSDFLALARQLSSRTGGNCNWLCEMHAYDGFRAYLEKDNRRLFTNFLRSLCTAPNNMRNRYLAGLIVKSLIGARSRERLRRLSRWLRSDRLRTRCG